MRTMYDSTDLNLIPASANMLAIYANGSYVPTDEQLERFAHAVKVRIDVNGSLPDCSVLDVERGDATPDGAREWLLEHAKVVSGAHGTIYCNASTLPAVEAACQGVPFHRWVADWTGVPHGYPGAVAVQYKTVPDVYDVSAVWDHRWHPGG
jgi:hypothetical protein